MFIRLFLFLGALCVQSLSVIAAPVQWKLADGGNGHFYDVIEVVGQPGTDFFAAILAATETSVTDPVTKLVVNGYGVNIDSQSEQDFIKNSVLGVFAPISKLTYSHAWIGLSRDPALTGDPSGIPYWVTDPDGQRPVTYFNWKSGQPTSGFDYGAMIMSGSDKGKWVTLDFFPPQGVNIAIVVEYNTKDVIPPAIPAPNSVYTMALGLGVLGVMVRRKRLKGRMENNA